MSDRPSTSYKKHPFRAFLQSALSRKRTDNSDRSHTVQSPRLLVGALLAVLAVAPSARAETVPWLYDVEVPASAQSAGERNSAASAAVIPPPVSVLAAGGGSVGTGCALAAAAGKRKTPDTAVEKLKRLLS